MDRIRPVQARHRLIVLAPGTAISSFELLPVVCLEHVTHFGTGQTSVRIENMIMVLARKWSPVADPRNVLRLIELEVRAKAPVQQDPRAKGVAPSDGGVVRAGRIARASVSKQLVVLVACGRALANGMRAG